MCSVGDIIVLCDVTGHKADPKKHVLIMDEVDGMAGNEDRGGMQVRNALFSHEPCSLESPVAQW